MERRENQPYYGVTGVIAGPTPLQLQQCDHTTAHYYARTNNSESNHEDRNSIKQQPFRMSLPRQNYYEPAGSGFTATIFPTPRYTNSSLRDSINFGGGGRYSGGGGISRDPKFDGADGQLEKTYKRRELFEWHSR